MALGGGTFTVQNKTLPGAYINVVSLARATATLGERGTVTIPYVGEWGPVGEVQEITAGEFQRQSMQLLGYAFTAPEIKWVRDLFKNASRALLYRLGPTAGTTAASNTWARAKHAGLRGNDFTLQIAHNVDSPAVGDPIWDVILWLGEVPVFSQTVANISELSDNPYVVWLNAPLALTAGTPLAGGLSVNVTNNDYQLYLDRIEQRRFNAIGLPSNDPLLKGLFAAFTKRMRDEQGVKFQCVLYDYPGDYEGVVNILNATEDDPEAPFEGVYWTTGIIGGAPINESITNTVYNGEYKFNLNHTQTQLENAILTGRFAFHRVDDTVRVLRDINSLVELSENKGSIFQNNQTIRVIDQIANDLAALFNKMYLGRFQNDEAGRLHLWSNIVRYNEQLQDIRAIQNFEGDDVTVEEGDEKISVYVRMYINIVNSMEKMYMVVTIA